MNTIKYFLLLFFIYSCGDTSSIQLDAEGEIKNVTKPLKSRFVANSHRYLSYKDNKLDLFLKSSKSSYDNLKSKLILENLVTRMSSGDDFIYILSRDGIHDLNSKNFIFTTQVKIVIEKKYLLQGEKFEWLNEEKTLISGSKQILNQNNQSQNKQNNIQENTTPSNYPVTIEDKKGLMIRGIKFRYKKLEKKFWMENTDIFIPDKMEKDEGLN